MNDERRRATLPLARGLTYRRLRLLAIIWILGIVLGSLSPMKVKVAVGTETRSRSEPVRREVFHFHRIMHYVGFGIGAALLVAIARTIPQRLLYCAALTVLGCVLEWIQYLVLGSLLLETWDMQDDAIAVGVGTVIASVFRFGARERQQEFPEDAVRL